MRVKNFVAPRINLAVDVVLHIHHFTIRFSFNNAVRAVNGVRHGPALDGEPKTHRDRDGFQGLELSSKDVCGIRV